MAIHGSAIKKESNPAIIFTNFGHASKTWAKNAVATSHIPPCTHGICTCLVWSEETKNAKSNPMERSKLINEWLSNTSYLLADTKSTPHPGGQSLWHLQDIKSGHPPGRNLTKPKIGHETSRESSKITISHTIGLENLVQVQPWQHKKEENKKRYRKRQQNVHKNVKKTSTNENDCARAHPRASAKT